MRTLLFAAALAVAFAAEPDARILRLITAETYRVAGIDSERYQQTRLPDRFPASISDALPKATREAARVRGIFTIGSRDQPELTVLTGEFAAQMQARQEGWSAVSPEPGFLFIGETETVIAAIAAWRDTARKLPAWTSRIREISAAYDNWMVVLDPIPDERRGVAPPPLPHWEALRKSVQVAWFGIRLGATHQTLAAVQMATDDDALAAAALTRWLPGLLQKDHELAAYVQAAENIETRRSGTTVELTFNLNDDKLPKRELP